MPTRQITAVNAGQPSTLAASTTPAQRQRPRRHVAGLGQKLTNGSVLDSRVTAHALALDRAADVFAISPRARGRILEQLSARDVSFSVPHGRGCTRIVPGSADGVPGVIGLADLFALEHPERRLRRLLPGIDPRDFGALLYLLARGHSHNVVVDLGAKSPAAAAVALRDGEDGNAGEALAQQLTGRDHLLDFAERMQRHGIVFSYREGEDERTLDGDDLARIVRARAPHAALAARYPRLNYDTLTALLADLSTLPGRDTAADDPMASELIDLSLPAFRGVGLFDDDGYDRQAAQRAMRNALWDDSVTFTREVTIPGRYVGVPTKASDAAIAAVKRGRVYVASTGRSEVAWSDGTGPFTDFLCQRIAELGKIGAALEASRQFTYKGTTQMATLTGDPKVFDKIPAARLHVLLIANSRFGDAADPLPGNRTDILHLRRALVRPEGPGIPEANVASVHDVSVPQGLAGMHAAVCRAAPGDGVFIYVSSHGDPDGVLMSDGEGVSNAELRALYREAEDRGVRLIVVSDSCYSGAQAEAVRAAEIERLANAGKAHPFLVRLDALGTALARVNRAAEDVVEYRARVAERWRLFPSSAMSAYLGEALARRTPDTLEQRLDAHPIWGPTSAALRERAKAIATKPAKERSKTESRIFAYHDALARLSAAAAAVEPAVAALRADAALGKHATIATLVRDLDQLLLSGDVVARELAKLIDRDDDLVRELLLASNRELAPVGRG
jgi:hypothetical protein